jgi:hypothetical protein
MFVIFIDPHFLTLIGPPYKPDTEMNDTNDLYCNTLDEIDLTNLGSVSVADEANRGKKEPPRKKRIVKKGMKKRRKRTHGSSEEEVANEDDSIITEDDVHPEEESEDSKARTHTEIMSFICASVINHDITKVMGH